MLFFGADSLWPTGGVSTALIQAVYLFRLHESDVDSYS